MSTDEYVPSDEDVYGVWTNYQCFGADDGYGPRGLERAAAEIDRYLARVLRDAKAEALRDAAEDVTEIDGRRDDSAANWLRARAAEYETGEQA